MIVKLTTSETEDICIICRENTLTKTGCNHFYHEDCLSKWFIQCKNKKSVHTALRKLCLQMKLKFFRKINFNLIEFFSLKNEW